MKKMSIFEKMGLMMNRGFTMKNFVMTAVAMAVVQSVSAQVGITQVIPLQLGNQGTELQVVFDGLPVQPKAYQLEGPTRLILDFEGANNKLTNNDIIVNSAEISNIDAQVDNERSRLTIHLKQHGAFTTRTEGNSFILKVSPELETPVAVPSNIISQPITTKANGLSNIGFERGAQGEGLVNIQLLSSSTPVDVQQQGSKVVIRLLGSKVPTNLARRLNVNDFATPVSSIDAYNEGSNGVIVIQPTGSYEYMAYQAEDKLTISVKRPVENNAAVKRNAQNYSGKKISLDFQDIEVRRVLQLLADFTDVNLVAADSVQGQITIRLKEVPWDQALDIILKSKNLDKRRNGNVIWIAPVSELIKAEEDEAKAQAQSVKLAPIQTDYIQLNYAKVADIEKLITTRNRSSTNSGGTSASTNSDELTGSLLSPRGSISSDIRTNTLIVNDTAQKIDEIRKMINLIDIPVKQVMIEARVVRATNTFSKDLGVKWGVASKNSNFLVAGSRSSLSTLSNSDTTQYSDLSDNVSVDLGVSNASGQISFGLINFSNFMLDLELSASEAEGLTEIVSTPKVLTADKQKALIKSGVQIPYQTTSGTTSGTTTSTEFKDAVLQLEVTPSITPDGKVNMQLNIAKDALDSYAQNGEAIISTNQITTNVLIDDGETVVLGGVFESTKGDAVTKIPLLGDLPYVGRLFRKTEKQDDKNELLIFVTPRIVNDNTSTNR
ncbi:type IV pilus assembly protein PilQ [Acinetobacter puyangensis]|uniref:Type IV pilus assembly protein PilQ n=2 Tax=Acinetobacter puyangensis TaxID=1096779 RepID=A0A240E9D3_9GAMM|nr:type IV pilus assembly protein PilQ [Acinetobacter puyangensis]